MNAHRNMQFAKLSQKSCDLIDAQNIGHEQKSQRINSVDQSGRTWTKQTNFSKTLKILIPLYELYFVRMLIDSTTDDYSSGRDETTTLKKHQLKKSCT